MKREGDEGKGTPEAPEVYAVVRGKSGWNLQRRDFLKAAACVTVAGAAGHAGLGGAHSASARSKDPSSCSDVKAHKEGIGGVAFAGDDRWLVSGGGDKRLKLWEVDSGRLVKQVRAHGKAIVAVAASPAGDLVATAGEDKVVKLWKVPSLRSPKRFGRVGKVCTVAFGARGELLATGCEKGRLRIFDVASGKQRMNLSGELGGAVRSVAFSPCGKFVAAALDSEAARVWLVETGALVRQLDQTVALAVGVAYSPAANQLAVAFEDGTLKVLDSDFKTLKSMKAKKDISGICFSHDGALVACTTSDQALWAWRVDGDEAFGPFFGGGSCIASGTRGYLLAGGSTSGQLQYWLVPAGGALASIAKLSAAVNCVSISPEGDQLVAGDAENGIRVFGLPDGERRLGIKAHEGPVNAVQFVPRAAGSADPDASLKSVTRGSVVASASDDTTVKLWDLFTTDCLQTLRGHDNAVLALAVSADGKFLASVGRDRKLCLWRPLAGTQVKALEAHNDSITCVRFTSDGKKLFTGSWDGHVKAWNVPDLSPAGTFKASSPVLSLAVSGNGAFAAGTLDLAVVLWDGRGQLQGRLTGHRRPVYDLAFAHDGQLLVSAALDNTVVAWNANTQLEVTRLGTHEAGVLALAINPRGTVVASGGQDRAVRLWNLPPASRKTACFMDLAANTDEVSGVTYKRKSVDGTVYASTMPCGSALPSGAVCTCNCVPGKIPSCSCDSHTSYSYSYGYSYSYSYTYWYPD